MIDSPASGADRDAAASGEPAQPVLDIEHLSRMTLGSRDLERDVLQLFESQAARLAEGLHEATGPAAFSCAHTLKGSARGIGAWRLARAAERVEHGVTAGGPVLAEAIAQLVQAVEETRAAIAERLRST